ncbi:MAG: SUMF1/EgtB/PvdO family nonheme iron enzyme [Bacteroidales bacterium]|jgi:formylglycine-generating enzyme required for sulfatase activity|nr:SUMF1/EgtB/PvdO family nonheme iron enzyme [Bacteroidales bacterium]
MNKILQAKRVIYFFILFCLYFPAESNNLVISSVSRTGTDRDVITATISWDNSWNVIGIPQNHDAVWLFIKFRECEAGGEWSHALLSTNMSDHTFSAGITPAQPITNADRFGVAGNHNTGVMIRRSDYGIGNISSQTVSLRVVGSTNGSLLNSTVEYDIKVLGIEMVYIPEGSFYVGDGSSTYFLHSPGTNPKMPYKVTSEASVTIGHYSNYTVTLNASFPKGYAAFYYMKYEITQGQYCDFLNTIPINAALSRAYIYSSYMYHITLDGGVYSGRYPDRAMNYMSYRDLLSYLDWAALRPPTEMEYEKACRGPLDYVAGEFAWGTNTYIEAINISGTVSGTEICTDSAANLHFYGDDRYCHGGSFGTRREGPLEVGIFARDTTTGRVETGAAYYGMMEMSGNVNEMCVQININTTNPSTPSNYTGIWGDGILTTDGSYNTVGWNDTEYFIYKGGSFSNDIYRQRVSDRYSINNTNQNDRYNNSGGRGCR